MAELALGQTAAGAVVPLRTNDDGTLTAPPPGNGVSIWRRGITVTNSAADNVLKSNAGAGIRNYVTDLVLSNAHTTAVSAVLKSNTTVITGPILIPAGATIVISFTTPLPATADQTVNLALDAAVAGAVGVTAIGFVAA